MQAATLLANRYGAHNVPDVLCTLLYIIFIVAIVIAVVGLIFSLITRLGPGTRYGWLPWGWVWPACVAAVSGLLLLFLC